jgi:hypothetical protein
MRDVGALVAWSTEIIWREAVAVFVCGLRTYGPSVSSDRFVNMDGLLRAPAWLTTFGYGILINMLNNSHDLLVLCDRLPSYICCYSASPAYPVYLFRCRFRTMSARHNGG